MPDPIAKTLAYIPVSVTQDLFVCPENHRQKIPVLLAAFVMPCKDCCSGLLSSCYPQHFLPASPSPTHLCHRGLIFRATHNTLPYIQCPSLHYPCNKLLTISLTCGAFPINTIMATSASLKLTSFGTLKESEEY